MPDPQRQPEPECRVPSRVERRVLLARKLLAGHGSATTELLNLEGREVDQILHDEMQPRGPFTVTHDEFRDSVIRIAAARFLDEALAVNPASRIGARRILDFLPTCLADLYLANACAQHPRENLAWNHLVLEHSAQLRRVARSFRSSSGEEEVNRFLADLWIHRTGGLNLIGTYKGLAPLRSWMVLVFRRRLAGRRKPRVERALPDSIPDPQARDPRDQVANAEYRAALGGLLLDLVARLPERDREFIEARILHGEEGIATAARFGVSPSYVSRRYRELLEQLRTRLLPILSRQGIDPGEIP